MKHAIHHWNYSAKSKINNLAAKNINDIKYNDGI